MDKVTVTMKEANKVLDHGYVRLVDYMGSDISVVRSARVSYDAAWRAGSDEGSDMRLIRRLARMGHTSPFEAVAMTFEVAAPIAIAREWQRHRTWSYNEISTRYVEMPDLWYVCPPDLIGKQDKKEKQTRIITGAADSEESLFLARSLERAFADYHEALGMGVPREVARMLLPLATYTKFFGTVNLHNLIRFIITRMSPGTQYEFRLYANVLKDIAGVIAPVSVAAWLDQWTYSGDEYTLVRKEMP